MREPTHDHHTEHLSGFYHTPRRLHFNELGTKLMHLRYFIRHSLAAFVKGIQRPNLGVLVILLLAATLPHVSTFYNIVNPSLRTPVPFELTLIAVLLGYLCNFLIIAVLSSRSSSDCPDE